MARVASGVSVVTTDGPAGRAGLTVSAMCSLSADPPAVLVCINRASRAGRIIRINGVFCLNVLASHQVDIARRFAGQPGGEHDKFLKLEWDRFGTGAPVLRNAVAVFDCNLTRGTDYGSHDILIGVVAETDERDGVPLLYVGRNYCAPAPLM
jgi:flavin reductase (DIM6/NTAB) family NADH-FMN oxidoreductase RutF